MITSKQRSYLRSLANTLDPVLIIGKGGVDSHIIKQVYDVVEARELIKIEVLKSCAIDPREACDILCEKLGTEPVQIIGNRLVLYRPSRKPTIVLP